MRRGRALLVGVALAAAMVSACGGDSKVGSGVDLDVEDVVGDARLGERTTTTTVAPGASQQLGIGETTTTAPVAPPTTQAAGFEIAINGDNSAQSQFHPSQARVFVGTTVRWVNRDVRPRSVVADDGTFSSPTLAPGQSFTWAAARPARIDYHDGTRPYAVATLEVVAR